MSKTYSICNECNQVNRVPFSPPHGKAPVCGKCGKNLEVHDGVTDLDTAGIGILSRKIELPLIVDFWAPWCGPCRSFAPIFKQAAQLMAGRAVLGKIDVQSHQPANGQYRFTGIPTLVIFKNGVEVARQSGAMSLESFQSWVSKTLGNQNAA